MGKYSERFEFCTKTEERLQLAIADELAELNRLKRIEIDILNEVNGMISSPELRETLKDLA